MRCKLLFLILIVFATSCSKFKWYQDLAQKPRSDKCVGIVDIYYNRARSHEYIKSLETSFRGEKFVTMTACDNCATAFVPREHYDNWAKQFTDTGTQPPHPRRTDTNDLTCHLFGGRLYKFTGYNYMYPQENY